MRKCLFCLYVELSASGVVVFLHTWRKVWTALSLINKKIGRCKFLERIAGLHARRFIVDVDKIDAQHKSSAFVFLEAVLEELHEVRRGHEFWDLCLGERLDGRLVSASVPNRLIVMDLKIEWVVVVFDFLFDFHEKTYSSRGGWSLSFHPTSSTWR